MSVPSSEPQQPGQSDQAGPTGQPAGGYAYAPPPPPQGGYGPNPGPGYGPGYGPYAPPYGYPGYPGFPPPNLGTNTMAILALVFAFVFSPLGVVFGIVALKQLKRAPQEGRGLAIAGIVVGAALFVLTVLYLVLVAVLVNKISNDFPSVTDTPSAWLAGTWLGNLLG